MRRLLARAALEHRSDDTPDVIAQRLALYHGHCRISATAGPAQRRRGNRRADTPRGLTAGSTSTWTTCPASTVPLHRPSIIAQALRVCRPQPVTLGPQPDALGIAA